MKKIVKNIIAAIVLLLVVISFQFNIGSLWNNLGVEAVGFNVTLPATASAIFPDSKVSSAVLTKLGITDSTKLLTQADLDQVGAFEISGAHAGLGVYSGDINLQGMEYLTNLKVLKIENYKISDLTPILFLDLTRLTLSNTNLTSEGLNNANLLKNMVNLDDLDLSYNNIGNFDELKTLVNLRSLSITSTAVSDITFLKNFTKLSMLAASANNISDTSPLIGLKVQSVFLNQNNITSIEFMRGVEMNIIQVANNNITDISPMESTVTLDILLKLSGNHIYDFSPIKLAYIEYFEASNQTIVLPPIYVNPNQSFVINNSMKTILNDIAPLVNISHVGVYNDVNNTISFNGISSNTNITYEFLWNPTFLQEHNFTVPIGPIGGRFIASGTITQPVYIANALNPATNGPVPTLPATGTNDVSYLVIGVAGLLIGLKKYFINN